MEKQRSQPLNPQRRQSGIASGKSPLLTGLSVDSNLGNSVSASSPARFANASPRKTPSNPPPNASTASASSLSDIYDCYSILRREDQRRYDFLWGIASGSNDNTVQLGGSKAVSFFERSGLDVSTLRQIWSRCTSSPSMTRSQFNVALRYISLAQNGFPVSRGEFKNHLNKELPLPKLTLPTVEAAKSASSSNSSSSGSSVQTSDSNSNLHSVDAYGYLPVEDQRYYDSLWNIAVPSAATNPSTTLGGGAAVKFFEKSGLDVGSLKQIWSRSTTNPVMTHQEFFVALRYISLAQNGFAISRGEFKAMIFAKLPLPVFESLSPSTPTPTTPTPTATTAPTPAEAGEITAQAPDITTAGLEPADSASESAVVEASSVAAVAAAAEEENNNSNSASFSRSEDDDVAVAMVRCHANASSASLSSSEGFVEVDSKMDCISLSDDACTASIHQATTPSVVDESEETTTAAAPAVEDDELDFSGVITPSSTPALILAEPHPQPQPMVSVPSCSTSSTPCSGFSSTLTPTPSTVEDVLVQKRLSPMAVSFSVPGTQQNDAGTAAAIEQEGSQSQAITEEAEEKASMKPHQQGHGHNQNMTIRVDCDDTDEAADEIEATSRSESQEVEEAYHEERTRLPPAANVSINSGGTIDANVVELTRRLQEMEKELQSKNNTIKALTVDLSNTKKSAADSNQAHQSAFFPPQTPFAGGAGHYLPLPPHNTTEIKKISLRKDALTTDDMFQRRINVWLVRAGYAVVNESIDAPSSSSSSGSGAVESSAASKTTKLSSTRMEPTGTASKAKLQAKMSMGNLFPVDEESRGRRDSAESIASVEATLPPQQAQTQTEPGQNAAEVTQSNDSLSAQASLPPPIAANCEEGGMAKTVESDSVVESTGKVASVPTVTFVDDLQKSAVETAVAPAQRTTEVAVELGPLLAIPSEDPEAEPAPYVESTAESGDNSQATDDSILPYVDSRLRPDIERDLTNWLPPLRDDFPQPDVDRERPSTPTETPLTVTLSSASTESVQEASNPWQQQQQLQQKSSSAGAAPRRPTSGAFGRLASALFGGFGSSTPTTAGSSSKPSTPMPVAPSTDESGFKDPWSVLGVASDLIASTTALVGVKTTAPKSFVVEDDDDDDDLVFVRYNGASLYVTANELYLIVVQEMMLLGEALRKEG